MTLHEKAKGTGSELDGWPLSLVVFAEFLMRGALFAVVAFGIQEGIGRVNFHRYGLAFYFAALLVIGGMHTSIYFLTLGLGAKRWPLARMQQLYRLGRNLLFSTVAALLTALGLAWWQGLNHTALYEGSNVFAIAGLVWAACALLGFFEALIMKRVPTGLEEDVQTLQASK